MKKALLIAAVLTALAAPASANHILNLDTPYATRGACEAAVADFGSDDRDGLLDRFPNFFDSTGDVASFLTRAFPCERGGDGQWYIRDRRLEVLQSDWFLRK